MKSKPKTKPAKPTWHEQLQAVRDEVVELQHAFRIAREVREATCTAKQTVPMPPATLTRIVDDLDLTVNQLQAGLSRLEEKLVPLLPDEMPAVIVDDLPAASDSTLQSQLLLTIHHVRIVTAVIDSLTTALQV